MRHVRNVAVCISGGTGNVLPMTSRYRQIMKAFGKQLRHARAKAGYRSAQQFAGVLGKEPHTYRHYERGEAEPDFDTLTRICELLAVTPNDLLPHAAQSRGLSTTAQTPGKSSAA